MLLKAAIGERSINPLLIHLGQFFVNFIYIGILDNAKLAELTTEMWVIASPIGRKRRSSASGRSNLSAFSVLCDVLGRVDKSCYERRGKCVLVK